MIEREHIIREIDQENHRSVIYWMERDHRVYDNFALSQAQAYANARQLKLQVAVLLSEDTMTMEERHVNFAVEGLKDVETNLFRYHIPMAVFYNLKEMCAYIHENASLLITDFNPLNRKEKAIKTIKETTNISIIEIDAHNIVPARMLHKTYDRQIAARTIRPKIRDVLHYYLNKFPSIETHHHNHEPIDSIDWEEVLSELSFGTDAKKLSLTGGETAALKKCMSFIENILPYYSELRNNPEKDYQSGLSPYFHFGHIAPQRVAYLVENLVKSSDSKSDFLEEMIIRRELTDNYCIDNVNQNNTEPFYNWAKETLTTHLSDTRAYLYTKSEFENASTHDDIWNTAQLELIHTGSIHGYLRMYWAKKILEWTPHYKEAFDIALYLNDKYALDGNDPNGIVGVAWSIGGIHDHGWKEREIFGKIRYMNDKGCHRKFDVETYKERILKEVHR